MNQYFRRADTFRQFHEGPLGSYMNSYGEWLHRHGYRRSPGRAAIRTAAHFSRWLMDHEIGIEEVSQEFVRRCKDFSRREKFSIRQIMTISRPEVFAVKPKPIMDTQQDRFLAEFASHLRVERGLAPGTIKYLLRFGAVFLREMFGTRRLNWQSLRLADIVRFFQGQVRRSSAVQMHLVLCIINVFTNRQGCGILIASCRYPLLLHSD
jgi:hypothetical protein